MDVHIGQEVYGSMDRSRSGSFAQFAIAKVEAIAIKPASLSFVEAASVPGVALTAWQALFDKGNLAAGDTVLIHGAAGGVGMFAVQLAKWKGARVIATASTEKKETVYALGADEVIDYNAQPFEENLKDIDLVIDILGGQTRERSWRVLRKNGLLVSTVPPLPQPPLGLRGEMVMMQANGKQLEQIGNLFKEGNLKTRVDKLFPLNEAGMALELNKAGHTNGKICLTVD